MKRLTLIALFTFIFITLFGLNLSMNMDKDGKMPNCPTMSNSSAICQMSTTEHIARWQAMFTATYQSGNLFLLAALFTVAFIYISFKRQTDLKSSLDSAYRYYLYKQPEAKLFNYLTQAFSDGILHPKIY